MGSGRNIWLWAALGLAFTLALAVSWLVGTGQMNSKSSPTARITRSDDIPACGAFWRVVDAPNPSKDYDELHAVAATSPNNVWAVGTFGTEEYALTLTERWDGSKWAHVPSPSVSDYSNHLYGIAALSESDAWAVGASHSGTDIWRTLAMRWDGEKWNIVPSPNVSVISVFNAVAAVSASDVWTVGESSNGSKGKGSQTLIEHWDGRAWSVVPSPNGEQNSTLNAIVAIDEKNIWAAGSYTDKSGNLSMPLFMRWDGKGWETSPNSGVGAIWSLAAVSSDDIWAVGNNGPQAIAMHWDGAKWASVPVPASGAKSNTLNSVAAVSADDVWAVGSQSISGVDQTLAVHWDGKQWLMAPNPSINNYVDTLSAITALSREDIWAVGSSIADARGTNLTLVQRYSKPCP